MPARTIPSAETGRGAAVVERKASVITTSNVKSRQAADKTVNGTKGVTATVINAVKTSAKKPVFALQGEAILKAISTAHACTRATIDALLSQLETTAEYLCLRGLDAIENGKTNMNGSARLSRQPKVNQETICTSTVSSERVHFAKQVVNAAITSLNEVLGTGWKLSETEILLEKLPSERSTSIGSRSSSTVSSRKAGSYSKGARSSLSGPSSSSRLESSVESIYSCARIATRYLYKAQADNQTRESKKLELQNIMSSLVRKMISMEMHRQASSEIQWLHDTIVETYTDPDVAPSYAFPIPRDTLSSRQRELALEVQAAAMTCLLVDVPADRLQSTLDTVLQHPQGPLAWQQYLRQIDAECSADIADKHAYSIERVLTKVMTRMSRSAAEMNPQIALICGEYSIDLLLHVSDLDIDALWDRIARTGLRYYKSRTLAEPTTSREKQAAFQVVDGIFQDMCRKVQERKSSCTASLKGNEKSFGEGFTKFCDVWLQLARKAGESEAMQHVSNLLARRSSSIDLSHASSEEVARFVAKMCADLSREVLRLEELLVSDGSADGAQILSSAEEGINSAVGIALVADDDGIRKIFKILDQLRRRALKVMEDKKCHPAELTALLVAICNQYEQYLFAETTKGSLNDDEEILDDYIYVLRSLANTTFDLNDWKSHEAASTFLIKCNAILDSKKGRIKDLNDSIIADKLRLLSSSWYFIGGKLYNEKKLSMAVRFLKNACETAQRASDMSKGLPISETSSGKSDNISKKWEHLAISYRYTSQFKLAIEAYTKGLLSIDVAVWNIIVRRARKEPICDFFSVDQNGEENKKIGSIVSMMRTTLELSTFELMDSNIVAMEDGFLRQASSRGIQSEAVAALLEYCLLSLDDVMHKEGAPLTAMALIGELTKIYGEDCFPIRRARVLIRSIELAAMQPHLYQSQRLSEELLTRVNQVRALLTKQEYSQDAGLVDYIPQYHSMLHTSLLLLQDQSHSDFKGITMQDMVNELGSWLDRIPQSSKEAVETSSIQSKPRILKSTQAPRQKQAAKMPTTPSRGKKVQLSPVAVTKSDHYNQRRLIDNDVRLCAIITTILNLIDSRGYFLPLFALLASALRLADGLSGDLSLEISITWAIIYTRRCLSLGLYKQAQDCIRKYLEKVRASRGLSADTKSRFLFLCAQCYAHADDTKTSVVLYDEAVGITSTIRLDDRVNSLQMGVNKCLVSERQSLAAETYALIQHQTGDSISALRYALLSLRCMMKCGMMLSRMTAADENADGTTFPFDQSKDLGSDAVVGSPPQSPLGIESSNATKRLPRLRSFSIAALHWTVAGLLANAYLNVANLYQLRGSARDAEAFLTEAIDFCKGNDDRQTLSHCLLERAKLFHEMGQRDKGIVDIAEGSRIISLEESLLYRIEVQMALAIQDERDNNFQNSLQHLDQAETDRLELQSKLAPCLALCNSSITTDNLCQKRSAMSSAEDGGMFERLRHRILLHRARILLRIGNDEEVMAFFEQAKGYQAFMRAGKGDLQDAKFNLRLASTSFKHDQVLGLLHESVLTLPRVAQLGNPICQAKETKSSPKRSFSGLHINQALHHLKQAQDLLEKISIQEKWQRIDSITLRESCIHLAFIASLGGVLGENCEMDAIVSVLERSCSLTLQREMLDALESKADQRVGMTTASIPGWKISSEDDRIARHATQTSSSEESNGDYEDKDEAARVVIGAMKRRHALAYSQVTLPSNYTVVSITLYRERNCLVLTRRSGRKSACPPVVCHLPIDRQNHREGEDNPSASIDEILRELKTIIDESNEATHAAQHLQGMAARKEWWTKRRDLDNRLKSLLELIETTWLGAFKSVLMTPVNMPADDICAMRSSVDALFQKSLFVSGSNERMSLRDVLEDSIFDRLMSLSQAACTDEELEDLVHFIMDAYQFRGCPIAIDEVDMDQCILDLRAILDTFRSRVTIDKKDQDDHLFLILDKDTSAIPWESLPILRGQAVCRIPSLAFLQDRLDQSHKTGEDGRFAIASTKAKVSYLLNPSKDLTRTQDRFGPWLESKGKGKERSWSGISNRVPLMDEMTNALQDSDLLLYFGHGGAEQYIRASRLKALKKCAVTMLWGCSSAVLKDLGDYDRTGTPYNYLMAGCPSLLGNLWDTTDKELDGISESVFQKMGLWKEKKEKDDGEGQTNLSITQAVAQSRNACKLPYLTGAACVIYGIPVYYQ